MHPSSQIRRLRGMPGFGSGLPPSSSGSMRNATKLPAPNSARRPFFVERDYSPSKWSDYFTEKRDIDLENGCQFRVYLQEDESTAANNLPLLVLLHGGGFSGLTWSCFVKSISELCHVRALAIDLRGHGSTKTTNDEELSLQNFIDDIDEVLSKMFADSDIPEIILMGHSMGGAIAVHYADRCRREAIAKRIVGLIVIDVVEGTAKDALSHMQQILRSRPSGFKSIEYAIEWYIRSGQVKNIEAAKISMPGQIKATNSGICATDLDVVESTKSTIDASPDAIASSESPSIPSSSFGLETVTETENSETSENICEFNSPSTISTANAAKIQPPKQAFTWRIDLARTEKYWTEWFENLSGIFLGVKGGAKLLLLAGVDRLDGPMTIGQMQGKFQMQVMARVGHTIQEDDPDSVAQVVATYLIRNRFSVPKVEFEPPFPSC